MKVKNSKMVLLFCVILLSGRVFSQQESLIGPQRISRYVYDNETYSSINGQGTVIKRDAGDLIYNDATLFRGEVRVESGRGIIAATADQD